MNYLGIEMTDEEFDNLMREQANGKELKVVNGKVVAVNHEDTPQEIAVKTIMQLKRNLHETDYQAIKFAEGELSAEEYANMKEQRRQWRNEINELEEELEG